MALGEIRKSDSEVVRVEVVEWQESKAVDIRTFFLPEDNSEFLPTKKGVRIAPEQSII